MDITTKLSIAYRMYKNNLPIDGIFVEDGNIRLFGDIEALIEENYNISTSY